MIFEYEQFDSVNDLLLYIASIAPYMKQLLPITSYRGYLFSLLPISQFSTDHLMMVYTTEEINGYLLEFDLSSKTYKNVQMVDRADKNYFVIVKPRTATLADKAIDNLKD
ncbi:MAG: hypothetical protein ACE5SW_02665 [Nitrososphaeraceae archaeon]